MSQEIQNKRDIATKSQQQVQRPQMYKVLLHNDDYTTMEFVVHILEAVFHKTPAQASEIMLTVHNQGIAVCGIYIFEVAETKTATVHAIAEQYEFPLRCSIQEI